MPTIGNQNVEATAFNIAAGAVGMKDAAFLYTAVAGDVADSVNAFADSWAATSIIIGIYTVTAGLPDVLTGGEHTIAVPAGGPPKAWRATAINVPLTAGVTYTIAWRALGIARTMIDILAMTTGSNDGSAPLPAIWTHAADTRGSVMMYANVTNTAPPVSDIIYPCRAQLIT